MLRNGHCGKKVGPRSKIFSPEKPPYWAVLIPLSNQNSAKEIYISISKFSHSYTLKRAYDYLNEHITDAFLHIIQCVSYLLFNFSYMKFCLSYVVSYLLPGIGAFLQKCPYQAYDRKVWQSQLKILKILAKYSILGWIDKNEIWNLFLNIFNTEIYILIMFFICKKKNKCNKVP